MSVVRKIVVPVTTLFLGLSAVFMAGAATAESHAYANGCDDTDWHTICP